MNFLAEFHPEVVHFPIAFLIFYIILEIFGVFSKNDFISRVALVLLTAGIFTAVFAVLTGNQAEEVAEELLKKGYHFPKEILEDHNFYATITLWYFTGILILRIYTTVKKLLNTKIKYLFVGLALFGLFLVYETGKLGGEMVFQHGIGTDVIEKQFEGG